MSRRLILAWAFLALIAPRAHAQSPYPSDLVPTRTALSRLGLERHWMGAVPLTGPERVMGLSMGNGLVFAQTNSGYLHAFDAESGALLWSSKLGQPAARARPVSANSFAVFVTSLNKLYALDRRTGNPLWEKQMSSLASSPTAANEEQMMVGQASGKVYGFGLKVKQGETTRISDRPIDVWNWQTGGPAETRPLLGDKFAIFGSDDGKVYVALADEPTLLYRIATGGPIGDGFGAHGTRLLLVPSADRNVYGVDLFTAQVLWSYGSGAPVSQAPLVAGDEIFVLNDAGRLISIDPADGQARWVQVTTGGRLMGIGANRVYVQNDQHDLYYLDRGTGRVVTSPRESRERAGLNLRAYDLSITNVENDRLYCGTTSGFIVCLREEGRVSPTPLRDPNAPPFGFIPREGISLNPAIAPPADGAERPLDEMPE
ncbi:MAG: PQQ-binding-like beta-propeller repeat protein [Isosphaeraceae bacterium]